MDATSDYPFEEMIWFVQQTLLLAVMAVGVILALRRWSDRGRSAAIASLGSGIGLLTVGGDLVAGVLSAASGKTFYTPHSTTFFTPKQPSVVLRCASAVGAIASLSFLTAALWSCWRCR